MGKRTGKPVGRPKGTNKFRAQQFIAAMPGTGGVMVIIAKRVGCHRDTVKKFIKDSPTVRKAYENEKGAVDDKALSNVVVAINKGDINTSKWWLTMKNSDEFAPRTDVTSGGKPITSSPISDDEYNRSISSLANALRNILHKKGDGEESNLDAAE